MGSNQRRQRPKADNSRAGFSNRLSADAQGHRSYDRRMHALGFSDNDLAERYRAHLDLLRNELVDFMQGENDFHLLTRLVTKEVTPTELADCLGRHRSTGLRFVRSVVIQFQKKAANDPERAERIFELYAELRRIEMLLASG